MYNNMELTLVHQDIGCSLKPHKQLLLMSRVLLHHCIFLHRQDYAPKIIHNKNKKTQAINIVNTCTCICTDFDMVHSTCSNPGSLWYGFSHISDCIESSTLSKLCAALQGGPLHVLQEGNKI